ncbi:MAG: hypothetical protein E7642_00530 [Ruminococcaceae bacterium]|nr:hypothetical protein [Oscillospiraceae bacterium]
MKKNFLKALSLLLVIVTLSLMVSCNFGDILEDIAPDDLGNGVENSTSGDVQFTLEATEIETYKETNQYGGEPSFVVGIPDHSIDFEGADVSVLYSNSVLNMREWYKETPEDEFDEAVSMVRNAVEEVLNVNIKYEFINFNAMSYTEYTNKLCNIIMTDVNSALHYYDVSANLAFASTSPLIRDYTANLLDEEVFPYFDFSLPCWNQSIVTDTAVNDQLFYLAGDMNISLLDSLAVMWYNKTLYDKYKQADDPDNLQDFALSQLWTYEELYKWTSRVYQEDISDDFCTLVTDGKDSSLTDALLYAWDIDLVISADDGSHSFALSDNDRLESALVNARQLIHADSTRHNKAINTFTSGNAIFYMGTLYKDKSSNMMIREMDATYGLLPIPKYNSDQRDYITTPESDYHSLIFVLNHARSEGEIYGELISAYLQLTAEEASVSIRGYYLNRIVKPKYFGTDDSELTVSKSIALLDVILANIKIDFAKIYFYQLNNVNYLWSDACLSEDYKTIGSLYEERKNAFETALGDTDAWLGLK